MMAEASNHGKYHHALSPRLIAWLGGIFIAIVVATTIGDIVNNHQKTIDHTTSALDAQTRTLTEQTAQSIQSVDVVLRHLGQQFKRGDFKGMTPHALHQYLGEQAVGLAQIDGISLRDATGVAIAASWIYPMPASGENVSDREYFRTLRDEPGIGIFVGSAIQSRIAGEWVFPIVRRLENAQGEFAGIVAARGRISYFQDFYRDIRLDFGTKVTLMHHNATMLARYPAAPHALGKHFALFERTLAANVRGQPSRTRTISPVDGVDRFGSMRVVAGYPLAVIVTRDAQVALAPWREHAASTIARTAALAIVAALLLITAVKQLNRLHATRASLEESRERYAVAVAGSDDGIWDWDYAAGVCYASPRAREILGLPAGPERRPIKAWLEELDPHLHPGDNVRRQMAIDAHLEGRTQAYECEYRVRSETGGYRWVRSRGLCVRRGTDKPHRMAGSITDIDSRRRAEEALRENEERFSLAVAGSNDGILDWDVVHDRMFTSQRAMHIAGVTSDVTVRTRGEWTALLQLHPDDKQRHDEDFRRHLQDLSEVREGEYRLRHPDGVYRWVRVRGMTIRDNAGRPVRWAGSVSDVDSRRRTEEALRRSEERFALAVAGSNDGIVDWDIVNDRMYSSERAMQIVGIDSTETVRSRAEWRDLIKYHPDDVLRMKNDLDTFLAGQSQLREGEYRIVLPDGSYRWIRHRNKCVRDDAGRPLRVAGSVSDIDAQKHVEGQLLQSKKLEAIGTLAGGIAHDFNNILAAILGYGEMAQKDAAEGTPLRRHIDAAVNAGLRAKSLVERILAFSRSGIGERKAVDVQSVVTEALNLVRASLPAHIRLDCHLEAADAAVMGDVTQIHQVVMNLCTNAAHAIKSTGTLSVTLDVVEKAQSVVATSALAAGRYVRLAVHDTGTGIASHALERIFDPFFTTKEVGVGTGLGLSLVHGIVTDLGGGIDVASAADSGTTFIVYLPWTHVAEAAAAEVENVPAGNGECILLVDDEEPLVRLGEELLAELGYEPAGFTSSTAAFDAFRAEPDRFSAILSDEAMPDMTGSDLAKAVRDIRPDLPIVLMSGFVSAALASRANELGIADVLNKPVVAADIARALANALRDSKQLVLQ